jgi:pimeloyl-ACP methyl ester carboxylesterase
MQFSTVAPEVGTPDMWSRILNIFSNHSRDTYCRTPPLILVNGLAEQSESWYLNRTVWQRHFDVHAPGILVYGGPVTQERLGEGKPIDIEFLTNRLAEYLDRFVQTPPYHFIASSLGAQISVEYAARHQEKVDKLVLICPSGIGGLERLPIMEGARHKNYRGLVESTFYDGRRASPRIANYYEQQFARKAWRQALFETVRGTKSHSVLDKLLAIHRPTLVICGEEDRIVDSDAVYDAVQHLPSFEFRMIPRCGHAPQLECPTVVNRMVLDFLTAA